MVTPDLSFVFHDLEIFLWGGGGSSFSQILLTS